MCKGYLYLTHGPRTVTHALYLARCLLVHHKTTAAAAEAVATVVNVHVRASQPKNIYSNGKQKSIHDQTRQRRRQL